MNRRKGKKKGGKKGECFESNQIQELSKIVKIQNEKLEEIDKKELIVEIQPPGPLNDSDSEAGEPKLLYPLKRRKGPPSNNFAAVPVEPQVVALGELRLQEQIAKSAWEMDGGVLDCSPIPWSPGPSRSPLPLTRPSPPCPPEPSPWALPPPSPPCPSPPSPPPFSLPALRYPSDSDSLPPSPVILRRSATPLSHPTRLDIIPEEPESASPRRAEDPTGAEGLGGAEDLAGEVPAQEGPLWTPPTLREAYEDYLQHEAEEGSGWVWSELQFKEFVWDLLGNTEREERGSVVLEDSVK